jgi:hypothetical protein
MQQHAAQPTPEVSRLKEAVASGRSRTWHHAFSVAFFGALMFVAGAAPGALPALFLGFVFVGLPWRFVSFISKVTGLQQAEQRMGGRLRAAAAL